jgi:hypothetical protein
MISLVGKKGERQMQNLSFCLAQILKTKKLRCKLAAYGQGLIMIYAAHLIF